MSVIQKIRDKYARVAVIAIALALLGFIAMDAFTGKSQLFGSGRSNSVGSVNGNTIKYEEFRQNLEAQQQQIEQQATQQGMPAPSGPALTQQAIENTWNMEVSKSVLVSELNKLGITVTQKELNNSILFGNNPPEDLKRQFTNPETGQFDAQALSQQLREIRKSGRKEQKDQINAYLAQLELARKEEKYNSLITNSVNIPKWILEKQLADNNQIAKISFIRKSYSEIADSTVKVTEQDIADYVSKHKADFKQEESRSISYVAFSALPSSADSATVKQQLGLLRQGLVDATDAEGYIAKNSSMVIPSVYAGKSMMQMSMKDTLQTLAVGQVYGPYLDGGSMVLAKTLDIRTLPDSVKCRHILIGTVDRSGQPILEDSVAKQRIDSIERAMQTGANFDTLETRYSTDQAAHRDKGVMTFSSTDIQNENFAKEFAQFILFDGKPGSKKVVKTSFGYHYIEILDFIKPEPHYKIAYLMKPIVTSPDTDQKAKNDASSFAGEATNEKTFNEVFEKKWKPLQYNKGLAYDITPSAYQVMGLGLDRDFVKKIYEAKKGEVLQPTRVNDNYVVAVVTDVFEKGTQPASKARMTVEPILRNRKKAEVIKNEIGAITTLEQASTKLNKQIETADSVSINGNNQTIGYEPKLIGAAFNPGSRGKVVTEPIEGASGVYVLRVENVTATAQTGPDITERRKMMAAQAKQRMAYPLQALREAANIKDNRSKFY
jgi:peptidyl-prolyl cis-trans isomerase D